MNQICQTGFAQPMVTKQISTDTDRNVVRVKVAQHELLLHYVLWYIYYYDGLST